MYEEGCKNVTNNLTLFQNFPSLKETASQCRDLQKENKYLKCGFIFLFWDHEIFLLLQLAVTLRRHCQIQWRNLTGVWADISSWKWKGKQWTVQMLLKADLEYHLPAPSWAWLSSRAEASHVFMWSLSYTSRAGWDYPSFSVDLQMQNFFSLGFERMFFNTSLDLFTMNLSVFHKRMWPNNTDTGLMEHHVFC